MVNADLPNVIAIEALRGHRLRVTWRDGSTDLVRFEQILRTHAAFGAIEDEAVFARVAVVDWGGGIEWQAGVDYAADALHCLASEQRAQAKTEALS